MFFWHNGCIRRPNERGCHKQDCGDERVVAHHKRRLERVGQRFGALIANSVATEVQFGDGEIGLALIRVTNGVWRVRKDAAHKIS